MPPNPLLRLHEAGQSIWLDYIDRPMLYDGDLERRIAEDAVTGMTSNPTIFEKSLAQGTAYDAQLAQLAAEGRRDPRELFEVLSTDDVRRACDIFAPIWERTRGVDGYVSIEVSPDVAHDADATVEEAHRLWSVVSRPNVMIKVPGTNAGATALRRLIADGVNVNVTLLFSVEAYRKIIENYLNGLEDRVAAGRDVSRLASVASFFVSRVDTEIDQRLEAMIATTSDAAEQERLRALRGVAAIANAKLAYRLFTSTMHSPRWAALAAKGARVQRPLWASTSTKNPAYRDVMYVEQLIGPYTVNTMPPATLEAFRDHGVVERTVDHDVEGAARALASLEAAGISLAAVTDKLLVDGLASFQKSFDSLLAEIAHKVEALESAAAR